MLHQRPRLLSRTVLPDGAVFDYEKGEARPGMNLPWTLGDLIMEVIPKSKHLSLDEVLEAVLPDDLKEKLNG